jgi:hypothetical protein
MFFRALARALARARKYLKIALNVESVAVFTAHI